MSEAESSSTVDLDSEEEFAKESDNDEVDNEMRSRPSTRKVLVPKQAAVYTQVDVDKNGLGLVTEVGFSDEVFSMCCLVNAENKKATIALINLTDVDVECLIPEIKLHECCDEVITEYQQTHAYALRTDKRYERLREKVDLRHLNEEERKAISSLLEEFSDIFFLEGDVLCKDSALEHEILVAKNVKPLNLRQYKTPFALKDEMQRQIQKTREGDLIEESSSPWNMPVMLIPKKSDNSKEKKF